MPKPFFELTYAQFSQMLDAYPLTRSIEAVHLHHTWLPNRGMYKGLSTIEGMWRDHVTNRGFRDIAQHITIAPDGMIWTGRDWNLAPASATGFNGNAHAGPFMFETIGNFDRGRDPFDGDQREAVLRVLVQLLERFHLPSEQIRFHNQMTNAKSCPGTGIDRGKLLEDVKALKAAAAEAASSGAPAASAIGTADMAVVSKAIAAMTKSAPVGRRGLDEGELTYDLQARTIYLGAGMMPEGDARDMDADGNGDPSPAQLETLRPYAVNMRYGQFAEGDGHLLQTSAGDVDAIVQQHLPAALKELGDGEMLDILLYAHGGLVSEADGLKEAYWALKFFVANKVYPVFFVWETGLWETLEGILTGKAGEVTRGLGDVAGAIRDKVLEEAAHHAGGPRLWGGMKWDAQRSNAEGGAAAYFAQEFAKFMAGLGEKEGQVRVHASGHSAGSIFQSFLLPALFKLGLKEIDTFHLLAPAIRVDSYKDRLTAVVGSDKVLDTTMYTMRKPYELADTCKRIYGHSLLYLIRNALEDKVPTPVLGLEESLRADPDMVKQFGLGAEASKTARVLWSPTAEPTGLNATQSVCHGDFHNDPATMGSLLRRIKHLSGDAEITAFVPWKKLLCEDAGKVRSVMMPARALPYAEDTWAAVSGSRVVRAAATPSRTGRRMALCIGIDQYPAPNTLAGCVGDAKAWSDALKGMGFDVRLMTDGAATYDAMVASITELVRGGRSGDTLVLQYSGHGTTVDNPGRKGGDGELAGQDEAFVPVDFTGTGGFLIDRQMRSILAELPTGVQLTCFVDCCHSATISRMAIGAAPPPDGRDVRKRFIPFTGAIARAYGDFQDTRGLSAKNFPPGRRSDMRHVVFSACKADEVAYERNGRGDFSRLSIPLLTTGSLTNAQFQAAVVKAFGAAAAQHPVLDCAGGWTNRPLFAFGSGTGRSDDAASGTVDTTEDGRDLGLPDLARRLRGLADLIG